jgi:hypothetical protein
VARAHSSEVDLVYSLVNLSELKLINVVIDFTSRLFTSEEVNDYFKLMGPKFVVLFYMLSQVSLHW